MFRLVLVLVGIFALSAGLSWLADRPGTVNIEWQGYTANPSVFQAIIVVAALIGTVMLAWSILRQIWQSPSNIGSFFLKRRNKRGLESLSAGMIAIGAGDLRRVVGDVGEEDGAGRGGQGARAGCSRVGSGAQG